MPDRLLTFAETAEMRDEEVRQKWTFQGGARQGEIAKLGFQDLCKSRSASKS
jgi:hypothetical protein